MNYLRKPLLLFFLFGLLYGCSKDDGISVKIPKLENHLDSTSVEDKIDSINKFDSLKLLFTETKPKEFNFIKKTKRKRKKIFNFRSFLKKKKDKNNL